jgi:hypothetical protein
MRGLNSEQFRWREVPADGGVCRSVLSAEHLWGGGFVAVILQAASWHPTVKSYLSDLKKVRAIWGAIHMTRIRPVPVQDWQNQMDAAPDGQRLS